MDALPTRQLVVVLGDQLDRASPAFVGFDPRQDAVWMAEAHPESTRIWSSQMRVAVFLAAMRHFAAALRTEGLNVHYLALDDVPPRATLAELLVATIARVAPQRVVMVEAGEWQLREALRVAVGSTGVPLDEREDTHFFCSHAQFARHAAGRRQLRMEYFYRELRRRERVLLDGNGDPEGGEWNYDALNRRSFGRGGPQGLVAPRRFAPDPLTRTVLDAVRRWFAQHPGSVDEFDWPVTRASALSALDDFVEHRLARFGEHQDAMWAGEPWLFHSRLASALNLKLLNPREVVTAAESAYRTGRAPLAAVEGFIRQVLGWREYVRGVYWLHMPGYLERNALAAYEPLPAFYWSGETDMSCMRDAIRQTLRFGYAHHIQRLMVTGLFALLLGVEPRRVHEWYLSVYVDAVEWVELPNTLGMSQYADGGVIASKPYIASGRYIERMSNHCASCRYRPALAVGPTACPFTTLYWDYLDRHAARLASNRRMSMQLRNLERMGPKARREIGVQAASLRQWLRSLGPGAQRG
jgi:deoxyribodipyrimidine photolyase-related protein